MRVHSQDLRLIVIQKKQKKRCHAATALKQRIGQQWQHMD
jgi:hypothetical protein